MCSMDLEIDKSFWRNYGPSNESTIQLLTRSYTGLVDRIYLPARALWKKEELETPAFTVDTFTLRTSHSELLQCAYFERDHDDNIFTDAFGTEASEDAVAATAGNPDAAALGGGLKRVDSDGSLDNSLVDTIIVYMHTNAANLAQSKEVCDGWTDMLSTLCRSYPTAARIALPLY